MGRRTQHNHGGLLFFDPQADKNSEFDADRIEFSAGSNYSYFDAIGPHPGSDRRLKTDIVDLDPDLARKLRPVSFRFKDAEETHYGFIAQEVMESLPDTVTEGGNGYLTLAYLELIAPLYALVQEQEKRINQLEERLKALEEKTNG